MLWLKNKRTRVRDEEPPLSGLDPYDPCEIDPPAYMFVRLGVAVAIVLALGAAAEHMFKLTQ